jgi:hypothetical protein
VANQYMTMATAYLSRGSQDLAFKQLSMAIKKAPTYSDIYIMRGQVYIQLGQVRVIYIYIYVYIYIYFMYIYVYVELFIFVLTF